MHKYTISLGTIYKTRTICLDQLALGHWTKSKIITVKFRAFDRRHTTLFLLGIQNSFICLLTVEYFC